MGLDVDIACERMGRLAYKGPKLEGELNFGTLYESASESSIACIEEEFP